MKKNKILTLLLSFLIAVGLWLYVVTSVSPGDTAPLNNIPVTLTNEETLKTRGLMLLEGRDQTVSLQLYGNRTDLWKLNRENVKITADLGTITEAGEYDLRYTESFPDEVGSVSVQSRSPARIHVKVVDYAEKNVPVVINYTGELAEGLLLDKENAELNYNTVSISGPKDIVETIAGASIAVDRNGLTETVDADYRYTLVDEQGEPVDAAMITTNTEQVHLHLPVEHIKEIALKVKLVAGGGATSETTTVRITPSTINISGSQEALDQITELELGTIDLGTVAANKTLEFPVTLPENVTNQTGVSTAQVEVSFKDLVTKTFSVDKFTATNLPDGLQSTVLTQKVEITIRGPKTSMAGVSLADIVATVDYTGQDAGTVTVPLTITVSGHPDVGAVGKYSISVTLAPPAETEPTQ